MLEATIKNIEWKRSQRERNPQKDDGKGVREQLKNPSCILYNIDWIENMRKRGFPKRYINRCIRVANKVLEKHKDRKDRNFDFYAFL